MKTQKICNGKHTVWMMTMIIVMVFAQGAISHSANQLLVRPQNEGPAQSKSRVTYQPYEIRKGQITMSPEILPDSGSAAASKAGIISAESDAFSVGFFADVNYEVLLDAVKLQEDGTKIISGKIKDHNLRTFVMTIASDGFIINLQDMNRQLLYRATGHSLSGSGTVTEIDMKKIPPMIR